MGGEEEEEEEEEEERKNKQLHFLNWGNVLARIVLRRQAYFSLLLG